MPCIWVVTMNLQAVSETEGRMQGRQVCDTYAQRLTSLPSAALLSLSTRVDPRP